MDREALMPYAPESARHRQSSPGKISLVIRSLARRSGGAERLYCELANFLINQGFEVACLSYDEVTGEPFYALDERVQRINLGAQKGGIQVGGINSIRRKIFRKLARSLIAPILSKSAWQSVHGKFTSGLKNHFKEAKPDVAISFLPPANTPSLLAAKGTSVKVIPTNHNVPVQDYETLTRWDPNPYDVKLRRQCLNDAAAIHVLFPQFGEWFGSTLAPKIAAIPNYVSKNIFETTPYERRQKTILGVGRLAEAKNYILLLHAWSEISKLHPEWSVEIYGAGPQERMLSGEIAKLGLQSSFHLRGESSDLAPVYASASIFCHPALFEGFGLSVAEALAVQLPVVAFADCAGVREYVVDGVNGIMVPRHRAADGLAEAISRLILDEDLRVNLGKAGPESIRQFTEQAYQERWLNLIEKVRCT